MKTYRFNKAFLRIKEVVNNDNFNGEIFVKPIFTDSYTYGYHNIII